MGIIYCATNKLNGMMYFGYSTRILEKRQKEHQDMVKYGSSCYFHSAIRKYGWNNFSWKVIDYANTKKELGILEMLYIEMFDTCFPRKGYNMTEGNDGGVQNEKTKNKMSESQKLRHKHYIHPMAGRHHSEEAKKKMSKSHEGKQIGSENGMFGKHFSQETIAKFKEARQGSKHPMYGKHHSEETKKKISESKKKFMKKID
jgi:group I intron endonuclease